MLTRLKNDIEACCPDCRQAVTGQGFRYGQLIYDCSHCNTWGSWEHAVDEHRRQCRAALVAKAQGSGQ